ncbi:hypothetical protein Bbelb_264690 [Branchiostoma belcheri]|nr:hypothetical protein Bbelb_264690 [Branchiostoma belcheri]
MFSFPDKARLRCQLSLMKTSFPAETALHAGYDARSPPESNGSITEERWKIKSASTCVPLPQYEFVDLLWFSDLCPLSCLIHREAVALSRAFKACQYQFSWRPLRAAHFPYSTAPLVISIQRPGDEPSDTSGQSEAAISVFWAVTG